jgi:hypothetical protein
MWHAILHYRRSGFRYLDFGRTENDNLGLRQFKRGWGADEKTIYYYQYSTKEKKFVVPPIRIQSGYKVFRLLPVATLRLIGQILYPHMG